MKKYSFIEFVAACESENIIRAFSNVNNIEPGLLGLARNALDKYNSVMKYETHDGDCTNEPHSCLLCVLEELLKNYKEYCFNEKEWREKNLPQTKNNVNDEIKKLITNYENRIENVKQARIGHVSKYDNNTFVYDNNQEIFEEFIVKLKNLL